MSNTRIPEEEARGPVRQKYEEIKSAFAAPVVPVFFTYIAPYEDYFIFIADQITKNAGDPRFQGLVAETGGELEGIITSTLTPSGRYREWMDRNSASPAIHNFRKDNAYIFRMNVALTFVFTALREAVKGWAVAARRLGSDRGPAAVHSAPFRESSPQYEDMATGTDIILRTTAITASGSRQVEVSLLPEFLELCREDVAAWKKTETYLLMRVGLEKIILASLPLFPHLVFSPINETLRLVMKYPDFPDLLYLLSDEFPTLLMSRLIFSGYMLSP